MKLRRYITLALPALYLASCAWFPKHRSVTTPEARELVQKTATYKFGESRVPLSKLGDAVRDSQGSAEERAALRIAMADALDEKAVPAATLDAKIFLCRQLALIGTADEVPVLAEMFDDQASADAARLALERIPGPEATRALIEELGDTSGDTRIGIVNSLGMRRDARAVKPLAQLWDDSNPALRSAVISALGKIGGDASENVLSGQKPSDEIAQARLLIAEQFITAGEGTKAEAIAADLAKAGGTQSKGARAGALRMLVSARGTKAAPQVCELFKEGDALGNALAPSFVRELPGGADTTLALASGASSLPAESQADLVRAISTRSDEAVLPTTLKFAASENQAVRIAALESLAELGDAGKGETIDLLVARAAGKDAKESEAARASLAALKGPHVNTQLTRALAASKEVPPRVEILRALGSRHATLALEEIFVAAQDTVPATRAAAYEALAGTASATETERLCKLFNDEKDATARQAAFQALASASRRGDADVAATAVAGGMAMSTNLSDRPSYLKVLGMVGGETALGQICHHLRTALDVETRAAAVEVLSQWSDAAPSDALLEAIKREMSNPYRAQAIEGYCRLIALPSDRPEKETTAKFAEVYKLAKSAGEKRAVIRALGDVPTISALKLAEKNFSDADVSSEAIASASRIAGKIGLAEASETKAVMAKAIAASNDPSAKAAAQAVITSIEEFEDYITAWQVAGPYFERGKDATTIFDMTFAPENPADAAKVNWKPMIASPDPNRPWLLDLQKAVGGGNRAAYLKTRIESDKEQKVKMEIGSDDGVKVWLNGAVVHSNNATRGLSPGQDVVETTLKKGSNDLLVKISNGGAQWEACLRLRTPDGKRVGGLKIAP